MPIYRFIFLFLIITFAHRAESQINFSEINYTKVNQKKILQYLHSQEKEKQNLLELQPSVRSNSDTEGFHTVSQEFFVKGNIDDVWQHYLVTNPSDSWSSKKVTFAMLFSKKEKRMIYENEYVAQLDTGQIVFLNLKIAKGLANLASIFEFITIDKDQKIMEFSYAEGTITKGKQQIQFFETDHGETQIIHSSFYKSESFLRDVILYPYFHNHLTSQFHRKMKKLFVMHEKSGEAIESPTLVHP